MGRRFIDAIWINQRLDRRDRRFQREQNKQTRLRLLRTDGVPDRENAGDRPAALPPRASRELRPDTQQQPNLSDTERKP